MSDTTRSQRWKDRRTSFRGDERFIDPAIHAVDVIHCQKEAKPFVQQHHYSGSFPASRLSCGLFRNDGRKSRLVGVACFSVSMNQSAGQKYTALGVNQSVELGRLVLLDEVEGNGESWFMSRAFSLLRSEKPDIEAVYAYSDPVPRYALDGSVIMPGHVGEVYQALSAQCRGRSGGRNRYFTADGNMFSERSLSKIRLEERGSEYATNELLERGVDERKWGETPREWIERLIQNGQIRIRKHPGNWVYSFGLTRKAKSRAKTLPIHPRPQKTGISSDVTSHQYEMSFA